MSNVMFIDNHISVYQSLDGSTTMIRNLGKYTVKIQEKIDEYILPLAVVYSRTEALIKRDVNVHKLFFEKVKPSA
jgi:hypothetical protein